jgi:hypothetical protein
MPPFYALATRGGGDGWGDEYDSRKGLKGTVVWHCKLSQPTPLSFPICRDRLSVFRFGLGTPPDSGREGTFHLKGVALAIYMAIQIHQSVLIYRLPKSRKSADCAEKLEEVGYL